MSIHRTQAALLLRRRLSSALLMAPSAVCVSYVLLLAQGSSGRAWGNKFYWNAVVPGGDGQGQTGEVIIGSRMNALVDYFKVQPGRQSNIHPNQRMASHQMHMAALINMGGDNRLGKLCIIGSPAVPVGRWRAETPVLTGLRGPRADHGTEAA